MNKWLITIVPPPEISAEIIQFQKELEQKYGSIHAQKAPPHITVIPPFKANENKIEEFILKLQEYISQQQELPIEIVLDNFQVFDYRTLFVDVAKNEHFESFCKKIKLLFNEQRIIPQRNEKHFFIPHITIANKDIKKKDFKIAWQEFKERNYQKSFKLSAINILKHTGEKWENYKAI